MEHIYDLIVAGGGFAGTAAAIEAARGGLDVLLIERSNCLGGAAASCLVMPFMNYWTQSPETDGTLKLAGGLFTEILGELSALGGLDRDDKTFDEELLKLALERMCLAAGVKLLLDAVIVGAEVRRRRIERLTVWGKSRRLELSARSYLDATGDAELAALAGCRCSLGRESDGLCQPMTLCFRVAGVDQAKYLENKPRINPLYREYQDKGLLRNPRENVLIFRTMHDGVLHFNTTRVVRRNPTEPFDVTQAEIEAREQIFELHRLLKEHIPGFEGSYVQSTGLQIGIRESRRIVGGYTLTAGDLKSLARFPDAVAAANYDIDIHSPDGAGTSHYYFGPGQWYEIPYRCLVPADCDNLLAAGRCVSADHEAQASLRTMPFCAELGQAAGAAVCLAHASGAPLRQIDTAQLRRTLRGKGSVL